MPAINTNADATLGSLAQYYAGNPNISPADVQTNTALSSPQAADWLMQQGAKLGIGDPSQYFQHAVAANKLAATPSGAQMLAARAAGQYAPSSLPGQLQARNNMWDQVSAKNQADSQNVASLQNQTTLQQNPLVPGQAAQLSPLQQQDAESKGQSPSEYVLQNRLGPNTALPNGQSMLSTMGVQPGQQAALPQDLYQHPAFQRLLQQKPDQAGQVFQALSGASLPTFQQSWIASQQKQRGDQIADLTKGLQEQDIIPDPNNPGKILARQYKSDPVTGAPVKLNTYGPGTAYQQSLAPLMPEVNKTMADFATLQQKKSQEDNTAAQLASLQQSRRGAPNTQGGYTPESNVSASSSLPGFWNSAVNAVGNNPSWIAGSGTPNDFGGTPGQPITHAAPLLRNNPRFQQLVQSDPAAAHRMILAIQRHGSTDTTPLSTATEQLPIH